MPFFLDFAAAAQEIAETRGSLAKTAVAVRYLRSVADPSDLETVVTWLAEGAFSQASGRTASVGSATIARCACAFLDIDYEAVFRPSRTATGSASETISRLMENLPTGRARRDPLARTVPETADLFERLAAAKARADKEALLQEAWSGMTGLEVRYFLRVLGQGSLRIGFEARNVMGAVAQAFGADPEQVRMAWMLAGSAGRTARLCAEGRLQEAQFSLFRPLAFMLASPVESRTVENWSDYVAEEKFDGMRCQLHASAGDIRLFSRDLNDITPSFPDLVADLAQRSLPGVVLDGEICVYTEGIIRPFQWLQKRMGVKKPSKAVLREYPVVFVAFDILYRQGRLLVDQPLSLRRKTLGELCAACRLPVTGQFPLADATDVERLFDRAIARGNEGLMLKRPDSTYEFGQRRKSWLKVKRPGGSLDTVILYATAGSGKRGGTLSDFTLAVRVAEDERFEQAWVPIGKAYGGYSNDELRQLNEAIRSLVVERFGPTVSVEPRIMVEIEFDEIQENKRTKAGYTLRFPRFRAIRWDKPVTEANTLRDVEQLYESRLRRERGQSGEAVVWGRED